MYGLKRHKEALRFVLDVIAIRIPRITDNVIFVLLSIHKSSGMYVRRS
jgi:hypothetical protein